MMATPTSDLEEQISRIMKEKRPPTEEELDNLPFNPYRLVQKNCPLLNFPPLFFEAQPIGPGIFCQT